MTLENTQQLLNLMKQLRHPETGCAWDVKQTFKTLIPYLIEESYEVIDAIEREDIADLEAELGDLLLQVVFHAQIASEKNLFDFECVAKSIADKLVRRHPHVFGDVIFKNDKERQAAWEQAKTQERQEKQQQESVLSGIAHSLPALMFSEKLQDRAAQNGFDWKTPEPVFEKVLEELNEVKEAHLSGNFAHIQEEIGDLLFVAVNLARHLNVNPEIALKQSNQKFMQRFFYIEQAVAASNRSLTDCELDELEALWQQAKWELKLKRN